MESELREEIRAGSNAIHDLQDMYIAGTNATLNMQQGIRNDIQTNTNAIQDMAFGIRSDIRESTYALVASQTMLAQSFQHGFSAVNNTLNLGFGMVGNRLDAMSDRICSKLDEIHDILNNPRLTESRELYRNALTSYEKGFYEEALEDCTAAVEKNKTDFISWYLLGHIYLFGAGKFSNVIDIDKAEEAFFNASKYIDPDIGHSEEANTLASEIYYYLGYSRLIKSNDLLIENKNTDSVKKLEEAEKASREASRLSNKNLFAVYEQAKELHFLEKDDDALNLLEQLIRTDKNYALKASNDKNFESLWPKIDELITHLRDEVALDISRQCNMIRAVWNKELELRRQQLADIKLPDEKLIADFEHFYHTELIKDEFNSDENLVRSICDDFNALVKEIFYGSKCQDVITCDAVIKNVRNGTAGLQSELDKSLSLIDGILLPFEDALKKDYFFVLEKQKEFGESQNQNRLKQIADEINTELAQFDKNYAVLVRDAKTLEGYIGAQKTWNEKKAKLHDEYVKKIKARCDEILVSGKSEIENLKADLEYKEREKGSYIKECKKFGIKTRSACTEWSVRLDEQKRDNATAVEELKIFLINTIRNAEKILDEDYFAVLLFWNDTNEKVNFVWKEEFTQRKKLCLDKLNKDIKDIKEKIEQLKQESISKKERRKRTISRLIVFAIIVSIFFFIVRGCSSYINSVSHQTSMLFKSIKNNNRDKAVLCIRSGADINAKNKWDKTWGTPLLYAVQLGEINMITLLINYGADVNLANVNGTTPIHLVLQSTGTGNGSRGIRDNRLAILEILIKKGADLNAKANNGWTPLVWAISGYDEYDDVRIGEQLRQSRIKCVEMLIKAGADVNAKTNEGETPLSIAKRKQNNEMIALLRRAGAK